MKKKSLDLSEKIEPFTIELFKIISDVAKSLNVDFFVVGATARDMILKNGFNISTKRATEDIDLGVRVPDWDLYDRLKQGLTETNEFIPDAKHAQRLLYKKEFPVDLIPFGEIADPNDRLFWPPDNEIEMSTTGFKETYSDSITVIIRANPILAVQFASLAGIALLKLIAWKDNYNRGNRDAKDLHLILVNYLDAGNQDRLYSEEADLLDTGDFDYERAGARLLGRDISSILNAETRSTILKILESEVGNDGKYDLVYQMLDIGADSSDFEKPLQLLEEMKAGIEERCKM